MSQESHETTKERVEELFRNASSEVQELLGEVLRIEQQYVHMKRPKGLGGDIADIVKNIVP